MILHPNGSPMLSHFIRPEFLIELLQRQAFHLIRQDEQKSDKDDGKLPAACFTNPVQGPLERSLGLGPEFLKNQAHAIESSRARTFIMSWTHDPSEHMQQKFGENGRRCELHTSELNLKKMLGYEWLPDTSEFSPKHRLFEEIPNAHATAQLKETCYTDGTQAIQVAVSYFATAHKDQEQFSAEAEIRIEAIIQPLDLRPSPSQTLIRWKITSFAGLGITIGSKVPEQEIGQIELLAKELGIPVLRAVGTR